MNKCFVSLFFKLKKIQNRGKVKMNISSFIQKLEKIKEKYGDLEIFFLKSQHDNSDWDYGIEIGWRDNQYECDQGAEQGDIIQYEEFRVLEIFPK